jgi:hypothetical protein
VEVLAPDVTEIVMSLLKKRGGIGARRDRDCHVIREIAVGDNKLEGVLRTPNGQIRGSESATADTVIENDDSRLPPAFANSSSPALELLISRTLLVPVFCVIDASRSPPMPAATVPEAVAAKIWVTVKSSITSALALVLAINATAATVPKILYFIVLSQ